MDTEEYVNIPEGLYKPNKFLMLTDDVSFFNGNVSMITSGRKLKFVIFEHTPSQTSKQLSKSLNKVIKLYGRGGFVIRMILIDMDF